MCSAAAAPGAVPGTRGRRRRRLSHGVTLLMYAAQQGDVDRVRHLIRSQPCTVFDQDRTGKTALHYCCTNDSKRAAQAADYLTMAAPELVETRDEDGFTPLHLAVIAGNTQLVTFLLVNGADVFAVDNEKHTVVHWATVCGETTALRAVLAAGAPVSTPDIHGGYPLHYAAQMCGGDKDAHLGLQVLHTLLGHKDVDVSVEDGDKRQPLLWAASAGSAKAILALVRAGAIVESSDRDGLTALHCSASRGHTDCLDTLLTLCGASPDVIDSNGCTALHYAVTLGHADATALLLAHGADANRQDRKGRSPAHCGCAKGQFETVKLIGARGANLWLRNARGDLPLHDAAASGRRELVTWLLNMRPSQVNARNNDGRTPLHMAALNDNVDMCKILLDSGATVNTVLRTSKNVFMTPLDCALQRGFRSTAKFLQLHGGVPAIRLTAPAMEAQVSSSMSLQIRDDVTFWGDSSSESEQDKVKSAKKVHKRKVSMRNRQRKNAESDAKDKKLVTTVNSSTNTITSESPRKTAGSSRINYSNEITINGRTEISVHQTQEIIVEGEATPNSSPQKVEIDTTETITIPESADDKVEPKTATLEPEEEPQMGQSTDDTTMDTVIDAQKLKTETKVPTLELPDISNTSEETEGPKELVVEASVHPEPTKTNESKGEEEELNEQPPVKSILKTSEPHADEKVEEVVETPQVPASSTPLKQEVATEVAKVEEKSVETLDEENETVPEAVKEETPDQEEVLKDTSTEPIQQPEVKMKRKEPVQTEKTSKSPRKTDETTKIKEPKPTKEDKLQKPDPKRKPPKTRFKKTTTEQPAIIKIFKTDGQSEEIDSTPSEIISDSLEQAITHKSFKVLSERPDLQGTRKSKLMKEDQKPRSKSDDTKFKGLGKQFRGSKIPTALSKSERQLDTLVERERRTQSEIETRIPSLPNIHASTRDRPDSNQSAPVLPSMYSDNERGSGSDYEDDARLSPTKKKKVKKRPKTRRRESRSAGSDYESSNLIDSGFEPSPRSSRIPKWKNMSERGVNMTSVTRSIQNNIRRYHLERKIFQHLLELKRSQIRAGQHNEAVLVKRAIDQYNQSCASTVGAGRYIADDYSFKSFEKFLYDSLRKLQKIDVAYLRGLPDATEHVNPLLCTQSTHRCMHATHAYTGIPCAAYLPKMDHHSIPKIGFEGSTQCKPGTGGFLPKINPKKAVTLELSHGSDKQVISLPTDKLDQNKRYYVTFTVKGQEGSSEENGTEGHIHSKSD